MKTTLSTASLKTNEFTRPPRATKTPPPLTDMQANDLRRVQRYLPTALKTFRRAYAGVSRPAAVKAKCLECCNLERAHVASCIISGCPLWRFRPYQHRAGKGGAK